MGFENFLLGACTSNDLPAKPNNRLPQILDFARMGSKAQENRNRPSMQLLTSTERFSEPALIAKIQPETEKRVTRGHERFHSCSFVGCVKSGFAGESFNSQNAKSGGRKVGSANGAEVRLYGTKKTRTLEIMATTSRPPR